MKKDKSLIPHGAYCYDNGRNDECPYWELVEKKIFYKNSKKECPHYSNCEDNNICGTMSRMMCIASVIKCNYLDLLDDNEDTLLWDQVKECGENE